MPDHRDLSLRVLLVATDEANVVRLRDLVAQMPVRFEVDWARSFEAGFIRMTSSRYDAHLVGSGWASGAASTCCTRTTRRRAARR